MRTCASLYPHAESRGFHKVDTKDLSIAAAVAVAREGRPGVGTISGYFGALQGEIGHQPLLTEWKRNHLFRKCRAAERSSGSTVENGDVLDQSQSPSHRSYPGSGARSGS